MSCRKATELISVSMDRPLTRGEKVKLRFHLVICTACRRYRRHVGLLRELLCRSSLWLDPASLTAEQRLTPEARSRIRQALQQAG